MYSPSQPFRHALRDIQKTAARETREDVLTQDLRSKMEFSVSNTDLPKFESAWDVKRPL